MGCCFTKRSITFTRNEILALNRDANKYGINMERYNDFCKSRNYRIAILHFSYKSSEYDNAYINAWNEWKRLQPWAIQLPDLDKNIVTQLAYAPTSLNNSNTIPKKHAQWQINSLKAFYNLQSWDNEIIDFKEQCNYLQYKNMDYFINYLLENKRYSCIVNNIKSLYGEDLWNLTQNIDSHWRDILSIITTSKHNDINNISIIEKFCKDKKEDLLNNLTNKIII